MKDYKAVIFDLDGTLLNTLDDLAASTNHALREMRYPLRTTEEVRRFVGNGIKKLIERAVPAGTSPEKTSETLEIFKTHYALHCEDMTAPYDGIYELLDALLESEKRLAVVSNKIDSAVSVLCKKYFGERMCITVGDREGIRPKPAPDSVNEVLLALGIAREDAVYIGDSEVDAMTAQNAEMDCISVTWGFRDLEVLRDAWGLEDIENTLKSTPNEGKKQGNINVFFANSAAEVKKLLLSE